MNGIPSLPPPVSSPQMCSKTTLLFSFAPRSLDTNNTKQSKQERDRDIFKTDLNYLHVVEDHWLMNECFRMNKSDSSASTPQYIIMLWVIENKDEVIKLHFSRFNQYKMINALCRSYITFLIRNDSEENAMQH